MILELVTAAALATGTPATANDGDERQPDWGAVSDSSYRSHTRMVNDDEDVDRYINKAQRVMEKHGIPGSHYDIKRNIMRESSGDPNAINRWDVNADNGIPSKGLLQTIPSTFRAYHVEGTPKNIYNPVANIVAACNYAADRYGSIDNVHGAY
jgi:hypothetical protein